MASRRPDGKQAERTQKLWQLVRTILHPNGEAVDYLGEDVACSTSHVVLGTQFDDAPEPDSGSVLTVH